MMTRTLCAGMPSSRAAERAQFVRRLRGRPDRQLVARTLPTRRPGRASRSAPARRSAGRRGADATCAALEEGVLVGRRAAHPARDVVGVGVVHDDIGSAAVARPDEVGHGGQRLVVDVDQFDGVLGDVAATRRRRARPDHRRTSTSPSANGGRGVSGMSLPATACQASLHVRVEVVGDEHRLHTGQRQRRRWCRCR